MKRNGLIRSVLLLAGAVLVPLSMGTEAAADDCVALGGALNGGECQITGVTTPKSGTFTLDETLHILSGGTLKVALPGITINISGNLQMDAGSKIDGDTTLQTVGALVTVNASGDIKLNGAPPAGNPPGAIITVNQNPGGTCVTGNRGGSVTLNAQGNVTLDPGSNTTNGSKITSRAPCGRGEIIINGVTVSIDGDVLSEGLTTMGRGGPITVNASCSLTVTPFGSLISLGRDPGSDLVHLQGGCDVRIFGLVASTGAGHTFVSPLNRCNSANRPDKPTNSTSCVEVWAGDSLLIDSKAPNNGEIHADSGTSGGIEGHGWIDLFSRGDITIIGDSAAPAAAHANQTLSNGKGGTVQVKSTEGAVTLVGLALQANDTAGGGKGGLLVVEAKLDVTLNASRSEAKGGTSGGAPAGGRIDIRSFGTAPNSGSILTDATSVLDVTGRIPPAGPNTGVVNLTACGTIGFPPGTIIPAGVVPVKSTQCGGAPTLASYVTLPLCVCSCVCVSNFTGAQVTVINGAPKTIVRLNGVGLKAATEVRLSPDSCEPFAGTAVPIILPKSDTQLTVDADGIPPGDYRIITIDPSGSCCTAAKVTIP